MKNSEKEDNNGSSVKTVITRSRHPALKRLDTATAFFYTPRSLTFLLLVVISLIYLSGTFQKPIIPKNELEAQANVNLNAKKGIWTIILVFIGYSMVQGPTTSMIRPHPIFWKFIHGVCIVYFLFMSWLLFQDVHVARQFMKHLSPNLGVELPEISYGANCALTAENLKTTIWDVFVLAHIFGWFAKALMIRDNFLLWVLSIAFELMELSFKHLLPNFNECWWDSWLLDVLICNFIGIVSGIWTVRWFECRYNTYNWRGISEQKTIIDKAKRSMLQFMPYSWDIFEWRIFSSPQRCLSVCAMVIWILAVEVQAFFLKYILWIPAENILNTYRLIIWFATGLPGIREYFEFLEGRIVGESLFPKLGPFAWLGAATAMVEFLICFKFGREVPEFWTPVPRLVILFWSVFGLVFIAIMVIWFWIHKGDDLKKYQKKTI